MSGIVVMKKCSCTEKLGDETELTGNPSAEDLTQQVKHQSTAISKKETGGHGVQYREVSEQLRLKPPTFPRPTNSKKR